LSELEVRIEEITEANLQDIPASCRGCVYWECPEEFEKAKEKRDEKDETAESQKRSQLEEKKREWFIQTLKNFGTCGKIVYYEGKPVAYAQFAPAMLLPNVNAYESKPVGKIEEGVVFISCLYISDVEFRGRGLGDLLLNNIIEDLRRRGFKAVETFARRGNSNNPSGPLEFYIRNGFTFKDKSNPNLPLMRIFL
jgi:ribosomal protein S18 acetylase RimI-like enzyme